MVEGKLGENIIQSYSDLYGDFKNKLKKQKKIYIP